MLQFLVLNYFALHVLYAFCVFQLGITRYILFELSEEIFLKIALLQLMATPNFYV